MGEMHWKQEAGELIRILKLEDERRDGPCVAALIMIWLRSPAASWVWPAAN